MLRTDTNNFNRFITSVGLLLLIAAMLVPYFYFHDTDVLRISQKELRGLTPVGRDALEGRQRRSADFEVPVLILGGALAIGGLAALWIGGRRLRAAQGKEDEALDRQAKRDEVEIQQLSESEVEEKRKAEARESAPEAIGEPAGADRIPRDDAHPRPSTPGRAHDMTKGWEAITRIQSAVQEAFAAAGPDEYDFRQEVKVMSRSQQVQLDGIFRAPSRDDRDVILELKVTRQSRILSKLIRSSADQLIAQITRYRDISGRDAVGWLLVVIPADVEELDLPERRRLEDRITGSLANHGKGAIVREQDIADLPKRFADLFEARST